MARFSATAVIIFVIEDLKIVGQSCGSTGQGRKHNILLNYQYVEISLASSNCMELYIEIRSEPIM